MKLATVAVLTGSLMMSGCLSTNTVYDNKSVREINSLSEARSLIKKGMTMAQVEAKLGKPNGRTVFNNDTIWQYTSARVNIFLPVPADVKSLSITFNASGRVKDVSFTSQSSRFN